MQSSQIAEIENSRPTTSEAQPWLSSSSWDLFWILSPAFLSAGAVLIFKEQLQTVNNIPLWVWVSFILLVDVAHVYASLFRTYLDPAAWQKNQTVLLLIPAAAWIGGSLLYSLDGLFFWRALAYLAVFHFIRQQFGFMVLYSRRESQTLQRFRWLDCAAIYMATIYPLLFWHTHQRNFCWFVSGDFYQGLPSIIADFGLILYICTAMAYFSKEFYFSRWTNFNWPKNLLLVGTALSWWVGIITVNSDMAFTITNVVSHGLPYMALVWLYHGKKGEQKSPGKTSRWTKVLLSNVFVFFLFLAALAYLEEGLWDGMIWHEHTDLFAIFSRLPAVSDTSLLALLVPFLALPQSTHYLLDGLIWRVKDRQSIWSA